MPEFEVFGWVSKEEASQGSRCTLFEGSDCLVSLYVIHLIILHPSVNKFNRFSLTVRSIYDTFKIMRFILNYIKF